MSETVETVEVAGAAAEKKAEVKAQQAGALARRLGLERAIGVVKSARKLASAKQTASSATFTLAEVEDLLVLERVHVSADGLAAAVKAKLSEVLD